MRIEEFQQRDDHERLQRRSKLYRGPAGGLIATHAGVPYDPSVTPTILFIGSSPDFIDPGQSEQILRAFAGVPEGLPLTQFDNGLQASFLTKPGDILVLQNINGNLPNIAAALEQTAWMWRTLTGRATMTVQNGRVELTEDMMSTVGELARVERAAALRISQVIPEIVEVVDGLSVDFVKYWNDKNRAIPHLAAVGLPVPRYMIAPSYQHAIERGEQLALLGERVVVKIGGGAGGVGIFTNNNHGYSVAEALELVRGIPGQFQLQKFVEGEDYGVVAFIGEDGEISVVSQHKQRVYNGEFFGGEWTPEIFALDSLRKVAQEAFLAQIKHAKQCGVRAIGPSGVDLRMKAGSDPKILECNMRETGTLVIADILESLSNHVFKEQVERNLGSEVYRITSNTSISVPPEVFKSPRFRELVLAIRDELKVGILTQGINVHPYNSHTKLVFINDHGDSHLGRAEKAFITGIDGIYEEITGKEGSNRELLERFNY